MSAPLNSPPAKFADGRFTLVRKLGSGSFGEIYVVADRGNSGQHLACKFERKDAQHPQLVYEASLLRSMHTPDQRQEGFPLVLWSGETGDHLALVQPLLGPSLEQLFDFCGRRFSLKTVLLLADQLLARLEYMHACGILHRDLKPENMLVGLDREQAVVYMIDFGLSKRYRDSRSGAHIPYRDGKRLTGTARYVSIQTHLGIEQSRRDDLESLGYVLLYFLRGALPWQGLRARDKEQKYARIQAKKMATTTEALCGGCPPEFRTYMDYCRALGFQEQPNYEYLRRLLRGVAAREGMGYDGIYDWNVRGPVPSPRWPQPVQPGSVPMYPPPPPSVYYNAIQAAQQALLGGGPVSVARTFTFPSNSGNQPQQPQQQQGGVAAGGGAQGGKEGYAQGGGQTGGAAIPRRAVHAQGQQAGGQQRAAGLDGGPDGAPIGGEDVTPPAPAPESGGSGAGAAPAPESGGGDTARSNTTASRLLAAVSTALVRAVTPRYGTLPAGGQVVAPEPAPMAANPHRKHSADALFAAAHAAPAAAAVVVVVVDGTGAAGDWASSDPAALRASAPSYSPSSGIVGGDVVVVGGHEYEARAPPARVHADSYAPQHRSHAPAVPVQTWQAPSPHLQSTAGHGEFEAGSVGLDSSSTYVRAHQQQQQHASYPHQYRPQHHRALTPPPPPPSHHAPHPHQYRLDPFGVEGGNASAHSYEVGIAPYALGPHYAPQQQQQQQLLLQGGAHYGAGSASSVGGMAVLGRAAGHPGHSPLPPGPPLQPYGRPHPVHGSVATVDMGSPHAVGGPPPQTQQLQHARWPPSQQIHYEGGSSATGQSADYNGGGYAVGYGGGGGDSTPQPPVRYDSPAPGDVTTSATSVAGYGRYPGYPQQQMVHQQMHHAHHHHPQQQQPQQQASYDAASAAVAYYQQQHQAQLQGAQTAGVGRSSRGSHSPGAGRIVSDGHTGPRRNLGTGPMLPGPGGAYMAGAGGHPMHSNHQQQQQQQYHPHARGHMVGYGMVPAHSTAYLPHLLSSDGGTQAPGGAAEGSVGSVEVGVALLPGTNAAPASVPLSIPPQPSHASLMSPSALDEMLQQAPPAPNDATNPTPTALRVRSSRGGSSVGGADFGSGRRSSGAAAGPTASPRSSEGSVILPVIPGETGPGSAGSRALAAQSSRGNGGECGGGGDDDGGTTPLSTARSSDRELEAGTPARSRAGSTGGWSTASNGTGYTLWTASGTAGSGPSAGRVVRSGRTSVASSSGSAPLVLRRQGVTPLYAASASTAIVGSPFHAGGGAHRHHLPGGGSSPAGLPGALHPADELDDDEGYGSGAGLGVAAGLVVGREGAMGRPGAAAMGLVSSATPRLSTHSSSLSDSVGAAKQGYSSSGGVSSGASASTASLANVDLSVGAGALHIA